MPFVCRGGTEIAGVAASGDGGSQQWRGAAGIARERRRARSAARGPRTDPPDPPLCAYPRLRTRTFQAAYYKFQQSRVSSVRLVHAMSETAGLLRSIDWPCNFYD